MDESNRKTNYLLEQKPFNIGHQLETLTAISNKDTSGCKENGGGWGGWGGWGEVLLTMEKLQEEAGRMLSLQTSRKFYHLSFDTR